jgi:hypothetical protein
MTRDDRAGKLADWILMLCALALATNEFAAQFGWSNASFPGWAYGFAFLVFAVVLVDR